MWNHSHNFSVVVIMIQIIEIVDFGKCVEWN